MESDIDALRAFRDKVLKRFGPGMAFVKWYCREGEGAARWLNEHPGFKPLVRAGLIAPVSVAKLVAAGKWSHHLAGLLIVIGCFAFAFGE